MRGNYDEAIKRMQETKPTPQYRWVSAEDMEFQKSIEQKFLDKLRKLGL